MKKTLQELFYFMSQEQNWPNSVWLMVYFALSFIIIGFVLAWLVDKLIRIKRTRPEAFDDLGFTWKGDTFTKIKKAR